MDANRRALLEAVIADPASSTAHRLKAQELLDAEAKDWAEPPTSAEVTEQYAQQLADDDEALSKLITLADEHLFATLPAYQERVQRRAEELIEERALSAREIFAVVDEEGSEEPQEVEEVGSLAPESEAVSGPESTPELHPLDEAALRLSADDEEPRSMLSRPARARGNITRI